MMKEDVKHIFDRSACLNKKQIDTYLTGNMITEEVYAVEHHINGCPLCSMALDGIQLRKDALEVTAQFNAGFLKDHLAAMPEVPASGAAAYVKNLKPQAVVGGSAVGTGIKLALGVAACVGILWFIQSAGKDSKPTQQVAAVEEPVAEPAEERSVVVEEPLLADTQVAALQPPPVETKLEDEATAVKESAPPAITNTKPEVVTKPATSTVITKPAVPPPAKITVPPPPKTLPVTATKPKPEPATNNTKPLPPPVKDVAKEQPKPPAIKQEPEQRPEPKVERPEPREEPKPVAKKEEAEELPADPIAAGKSLMDKRNYNAAINKMRNEMRSNNKSRRQEAVMLVAKCYQQMGNKDRAKELLKTLVDEGGPEKKAAKKLLKEVDKDARTDE